MKHNTSVEWFGEQDVLVITDVPKSSAIKALVGVTIVVGSVWVTAHEYFKERRLNKSLAK